MYLDTKANEMEWEMTNDIEQQQVKIAALKQDCDIQHFKYIKRIYLIKLDDNRCNFRLRTLVSEMSASVRMSRSILSGAVRSRRAVITVSRNNFAPSVTASNKITSLQFIKQYSTAAEVKGMKIIFN